MYSLTGEAIGRTGKCRCGHRFLVTGPHSVTISAEQACLCICPHCQARVVASHDAPGAMALCCRCGKPFQTNLTSDTQAPHQDGLPPESVQSSPVQSTSAPHSTESVEAAVRAIVDEWSPPTQASHNSEIMACPSGGISGAMQAVSEQRVKDRNATAHGIGLWTVFQCPECCHHTAFVATSAKTDVQCGLIARRMANGCKAIAVPSPESGDRDEDWQHPAGPQSKEAKKRKPR